MSKHFKETFSFLRATVAEDRSYLEVWLRHPSVRSSFAAALPAELEMVVRVWMDYGVIAAAGITYVSDQEPAGMAVLYLQPFASTRHLAYASFLVDHNKRGHGIGTLLLAGLKNLAKDQFGLEIMVVELFEGNPAEHLYARSGFHRVGVQSMFGVDQHGNFVKKILMQMGL